MSNRIIGFSPAKEQCGNCREIFTTNFYNPDYLCDKCSAIKSIIRTKNEKISYLKAELEVFKDAQESRKKKKTTASVGDSQKWASIKENKINLLEEQVNILQEAFKNRKKTFEEEYEEIRNEMKEENENVT